MGTILNWNSGYTGNPGTEDDRVTNFPALTDDVHVVMASHVNSLADAVVQLQNTQSTLRAIEVQDEGSPLTSTLESINFVGTGVTVTNSGNDVTVTLSGSGGAGTLQEAYDGGAAVSLAAATPISILSASIGDDAIVVSDGTNTSFVRADEIVTPTVVVGDGTGSDTISIEAGSSNNMFSFSSSQPLEESTAVRESFADFSFEVNQSGSALGYSGISVNVTETSAIGTDDRLVDLAVGGTTELIVRPDGTLSRNGQGPVVVTRGDDTYATVLKARDASGNDIFEVVKGTGIRVSSADSVEFRDFSTDTTVASLSVPSADTLALTANSESVIIDNDSTTPSLRPDADSVWTLGEAAIAWSNVFSDKVTLTDDGTEAAPAITFGTSTSSGFRFASNTVRVVEGGQDVIAWSYDGGTGQAVSRAFTEGSRARPTYGWNGRDTSGLFASGVNVVGLSANQEAVYLDGSIPSFYPRTDLTHDLGTDTLAWKDTYTERILLEDGTNAAPSISFQEDDDTGIRRVFTDNIGIVTNGSLRIGVTDSVLYSNVDLIPSTSGVGNLGGGSNIWAESWANLVLSGDGVIGAPGLCFISEQTSGLYRAGTHVVGIAANNKAILFDGTNNEFYAGGDNSFDLGTSSFRWREVHAVNVYTGDLVMHDRSQGHESPFMILQEGFDQLIVFDVQSLRKYKVPLEEVPATEEDVQKMLSMKSKYYGE